MAVITSLRGSSGLFRRLVWLCVACNAFLLLQWVFRGDPQPTRSRQRFPQKIWQTWKVGPLEFQEADNRAARSWIEKNPTYRYEVLTDANAQAFVEESFGPEGVADRPDIVRLYQELRTPIIKADLLRYLIMYVEGGVYTDIDVQALRPVSAFIPKNRYKEEDIDMIIAVETDESRFKDHPILGLKAQSFCQWTFVCKPGLPVMLKLVDHIIKWVNILAAKQGRSVSEIEANFDNILNICGPSAFTRIVLDDMASKTGGQTTWETFHDLVESTVVARTLVLPSEAFCAGTGHSDSGNHEGKGAMVKHHFGASAWPLRHPRFSHPIYGPVEYCNWDPECVKMWDDNTAHFDALPEPERLQMIAMKELETVEEKQIAIVPAAKINRVQAAAENPLELAELAELARQKAAEENLPTDGQAEDKKSPADVQVDGGLADVEKAVREGLGLR